MKNKEVKKVQRKVNKIVRAMNRNIENDELWRGRFAVRQFDRTLTPYADHSGYSVRIFLQYFDKKTGQTYQKIVDAFSGFFAKITSWDIWEGMNYFITEVVKVWEEEPDIRTQRVDYTSDKRWTKGK